jgi:hypothetical protein
MCFDLTTQSLRHDTGLLGRILRTSAMLLLLLTCCAASALAAFMAAGQISQTSDTVQSFLAA